MTFGGGRRHRPRWPAVLALAAGLAGCTGDGSPGPGPASGAPAGSAGSGPAPVGSAGSPGPAGSAGSGPGSAAGAPAPTPAVTLRWTACPLPGSRTALVRAVAAGGAGVPWTAVGQERGRAGVLPAVWTAADGCRWRRVPVRAITPDGEDSGFVSVARRGRLVAALGAGSSPAHGNTRPTLWRAAGAGPLGEVRLLRELFGGPNGISVAALAATPGAFYAAGGWVTPSLQPAAQVWRSTDGARWQRLDPPAELVSSRSEQLLVRDLTAGPAGVLVIGIAVQLRDGLRDGADAAAWSAGGDARRWRRGVLRGAGLTGPGDQRLVGATWLAPRYVAVAAVPAGTGVGLRSAVSPDGRAWAAGGALPLAPALPGPSIPTVRLAAAPGGGVLAGTAAGGRLLLWRSPSGSTWRPEAPPGPDAAAGTGLAVAAAAGRLALVLQTDAGPRAYLARARG